MIVLDASAAIELLLNTRLGKQLAKQLRRADVSLHAPHLIDLEVAQTFRRYVVDRTLPEEDGRLALQHLAMLDLHRYPHDSLLRRIWGLRDNLTAYDGAYVALAEALGATLVTADGRLARSPGLRADIELLR